MKKRFKLKFDFFKIVKKCNKELSLRFYTGGLKMKNTTLCSPKKIWDKSHYHTQKRK